MGCWSFRKLSWFNTFLFFFFCFCFFFFFVNRFLVYMVTTLSWELHCNYLTGMWIMSVTAGDKKSVSSWWLQVQCKFVFLPKIEQSLTNKITNCAPFSVKETSELLVLRKITSCGYVFCQNASYYLDCIDDNLCLMFCSKLKKDDNSKWVTVFWRVARF